MTENERLLHHYSGGWIGVDLDGTLAHYDRWVSLTHIGPPVPRMLDRVKTWLTAGVSVKIFTARAGIPECDRAIVAWCMEHLGREIPITATKDFKMIELWDDRAVQVIPNTGYRVDREP